MNAVDELTETLALELDIDRVVAMTQALIEVPSVNPFGAEPSPGNREQEVADLFATMLIEAGLSVEQRLVNEGRPNVIATLSGTADGATLMFAGHLDTVGVNGYNRPFAPRIEAGRVYGRGSCDMKGAMACFVEVARVIAASDVQLRGTLIIAGTADEEDLMIGSAQFREAGPAADYCIVGEPTSLEVCPVHKGQMGTTITTFGTAVHSSVPERGVNAIAKMAKVVAGFADYNTSLADTAPHELCGTGTFSIGVIRGGDISSTVPDRCEIDVDRRLIPGETADDVMAEYRLRLNSIAADDPDFRYEISDPTMLNPFLDTPLDSEVVTTSVAAYEWATGGHATITALSGCTDAPNFGAPAVIVGPGSLTQAHSTNEFVEIEELEAATRLYLHSAVALLLAAPAD